VSDNASVTVTEHDEQKAESRHAFREPLRRPGSHMRRGLPHRQLKHDMGKQCTETAAGDLHNRVQAGV
jgi:hypothetical protein